MIRPPRRAVTRFLIPFIDVLILLFCIFLLMPFVARTDISPANDSNEPNPLTDRNTPLSDSTALRRQIEFLKKQLENPFATIDLQMLDIDKDTGRLFVTHSETGK